ncbi:MAG: hypothetical protein A2655_03605 [Candidatus Yanofskybacteria bacterium RIFCSPHIGHO2_01_FULL_43_42]|uniref:Uncharacterized protein n=1 Tax=Candidatus Collierbacteria bacterium RIFCSPHIGHO2_02_FULL_49_10 TaxID=1817723 RepID=A0A1F5EVV2_9BACT|nr:MAG: hypothetical protein A3D09_02205 [Candidatus Collierbacteria bacterium RIFCSPHIGHO2_02_FULL_49_10]OGN03255.1 MAG: hypothetical protein A2655_03605 [Candidatus Yanofskybacteria bacterium RIFCSPHIGHO2_01_FULL_43_42]
MENSGPGVAPGEHQVPHFSYHGEKPGVFDDGMFFLLIQIPKRRENRGPPFLDLAMHSPQSIFTQIDDELVRHSAFNAKKQGIIFRPIDPLRSLNRLQNTLLQ